MKAEIKSFCLEYDYPQEAIDSLLNDFTVLKKSEYYPLFHAHVDLYNNDDSSYDHSQSLKAMEFISQNIGIHEYSLKFLLHVCMARHCRELYDQAELPVSCYHGAMLDLKWKLLECKRVMGIWGTFVAPWFDRFFNLSRFTLGKLQFEDDISMETYKKNGCKLNYGDWIITVHLPTCGPIDTEECLQAFRKAEEFFSDRFPDGIAKFRLPNEEIPGMGFGYLFMKDGNIIN